MAYRNFFASISGKRKGRKVAPPRFRSRKDNRQAIRFTEERPVQGPGQRPAAAAEDRRRGGALVTQPAVRAVSSVTVIRDAAGRYFASFVVQTTGRAAAAETDSEVGIDLGLTHFAVLSDGTKVAAPKFLRRAARKLKRLQQDLSRKQRGSQQPQEGRREGRPRSRAGGRHPAGLAAQALDIDHPRQPSGVRRGPVRGRSRPDPAGEVRARRRLGSVHGHVGVQGRPVRADLRPGGPVLPVHPRCARTAAGSTTRWRSTSERGTARAAAPTTGTSTPPRTYWPPDRRTTQTPVERR